MGGKDIKKADKLWLMYKNQDLLLTSGRLMIVVQITVKTNHPLNSTHNSVTEILQPNAYHCHHNLFIKNTIALVVTCLIC